MIATDGRLRTAGLNLAVSVTSPGWKVGITAVIKDFKPSEAIIAVDSLISPGTAVNVAIDAFAFNGEVLYCERRGARYEAHVYRSDTDKAGSRRTPRFPVQIPGRVFAPGRATPIPVTIVDISGEGLGIELASHLPTAKTVAVESESNVAFGIVRFSRRLSKDRVRVGVLLHQIIRKQAAVPSTRNELMARMSEKMLA